MYLADEQERDEVTAVEHHTEGLVYPDLTKSQRHILEEAGLEPEGASRLRVERAASAKVQAQFPQLASREMWDEH